MNDVLRLKCDRCQSVLLESTAFLEDCHPDVDALTPYTVLCPVCLNEVAVEISKGLWCINPPGALRLKCSSAFSV